jgi:predicted deacetylase
MPATNSARWACAVMLSAACSRTSAPPEQAHGRIVVALTIDWEGAVLSSESLDAIDELRKVVPDAPLTHFVSAAYFTKAHPDPTIVDTLGAAVRKGDELAVHLHAWRSLAKASKVEPKLSPSYLNGTEAVQPADDGDVGFDVDLDVYDVGELRALLRTSHRLLEQAHLPIGKAFRAGGYLGTPKMLQAIHDEGFTLDSSATDHHPIDAASGNFLRGRLGQLWPKLEPTSQPFAIAVAGGDVLELPIAAIADYTATAEIGKVFEAAHAHLQSAPTRDVFVVLAFHQETATDYGNRLRDAITAMQARKEIAGEVVYVTMETAGDLARPQL